MCIYCLFTDVTIASEEWIKWANIVQIVISWANAVPLDIMYICTYMVYNLCPQCANIVHMHCIESDKGGKYFACQLISNTVHCIVYEGCYNASDSNSQILCTCIYSIDICAQYFRFHPVYRFYTIVLVIRYANIVQPLIVHIYAGCCASDRRGKYCAAPLSVNLKYCAHVSVHRMP